MSKTEGLPVSRETPKIRIRRLIIYLIPATVIYIYYLLHISYVVEYGLASQSKLLYYSLNHMQEYPLEIDFNSNIFIKGFLFYLITVSLTTLIYMTKPYKYRATAGDEQGSAKWNYNIKSYNKKFSFPKGKDYAEISYKKDDTRANKKARGGNDEDLKDEYLKKEGYVLSPNMILSKNVNLSMRGFETMRNNNVIVIGGSGTGKSRFYVKPNLLQANASYIITDPSGELLQSHGQYLKDMGYKIKVFNLVDMDLSNKYNPFNYIREEKTGNGELDTKIDQNGIAQMINTFIVNTTPTGKSSSDPFWENAEKLLLTAICFYLKENHGEKKDINFYKVTELITHAIPKEDGEETELDKLFREVEKNDPDSIALFNYKNFKQAAGDTAKSIVISAQARLFPFSLSKVRDLTSEDNMDLTSVGEEKTAVFCILPTADTTFNWIVSLLYSQLFETLYYQAEHNDNKRLKIPVVFYLDEFANIGKIPDFTNKLATMRKYGISCSVILQNLNQLEKMYEKDYKSLVGNCDSIVFLGSGEKDTQKYFSELLGSTTIYKKSGSKSYGRNKSHSISEDVIKRELMTPDEIGIMDNEKSIIILRGERPFKDDKFPYQDHPLYKYCGDGDKKKEYFIKDNLKDLGIDEEEIKEKIKVIELEEKLDKDKEKLKDWQNQNLNIFNKYA